VEININGMKRPAPDAGEAKAPKKMVPQPLQNGVSNGFGVHVDDDETIDEERFFPIAVVGMGCRMPGNVNTPQEFQKVMEEGIDVISEVPTDRWDVDKYWHPDPHNVGTHCNKRAGFCENVHDFDHTFYNISPREAANMDVMHRGIMEVTQECLDDAGIPSETMPRDTGVYVGVCLMDHGFTVIEDAKCMNAYTHTGTAHSVAANRVSFAYDIRGPSVAIDTACAASLTAAHYACFALWNKECPEAIVAASNTLMVPEVTVGFSALGVLSPEGVSCPFSARAKGYVRSEGTGAFYIKPLKDALEHGDHIYCTIRASWLAHNGYSLSITMPSTEAQAEMMKKTYDVFGLDINKTDYVEAHGTGTPVGDPLEAEGIAQAFTIGNKQRKNPLPVGSSKSNFGHMEGAAGMVQVFKSALMLENRKIYKNINFGEPNPAIDMEGWRVRVPTENEEFKENKPMRIGINTFGFGGALAHMVFEEAEQKYPPQKNKGTAGWKFGRNSTKGLKIPVPLSAKSTAALRGLCAKWLDYSSDDDAMEVTCWLATRRSHYSNRIVIFADSGEDFREKLQIYIDKQAHDELVEATLPPHVDEKKICFIFPGQGQQYFDMGRVLYKDEPVFKKACDDCDAIYKKLSGKSFMHTYNLFVPLDPSKKYDPNVVNEIQVSQPAILYLQVGMFHLMLHWGIEPDAVVGHSLGEVAAAYASGAVSLEEAVTVQYYRAEQQVKLDGTGSMAAFRVSPEEGEKLCLKYKDMYVACTNAQESITVAGSKAVIKEICQDNPSNAKELRVKCAFHTPHMDPLKDEFMKSVQGKLSNGKPKRYSWYSTVTGKKMESSAGAKYFWDNIRSRVEFLDAVRGVMEEFQNVLFVEIAGAATLLSSIRAIAKGEDVTPAGMVPCGQRNKDDRVAMLRALATLHGMAIKVDWLQGLGDCAKWMRLPLYAWQHSTFRYEAEGMRLRRLDLEDHTFNGLHGLVRLEQLPFIRDHIINGKLCMPRSAYLEYILEANFTGEEIPSLSNIKFHTEFLELNEDVDLNGESPERKQMSLSTEQIQHGKSISCLVDGDVHCQAEKVSGPKSEPQIFDLAKLKSRCQDVMSGEEFYENLADVGIEYADAMRFRAVQEFYLGDGEALASLVPVKDKRERVNTIALDASFSVAIATQKHNTTLLTPTTIEKINMYVPSLPRKVPIFVYARLTHCDSMNLQADVFILDGEGHVLVEIQQFKAENVHGSVTAQINLAESVYTTIWQPITACLPTTTMVKDFFSEENLRERYPEEMDAIDEAEKYSNLTKEICAAYAKHATTLVPEKDVNQKVERYDKRLRQMADIIPTNLKIDDIPKRIEQIEKSCPAYHQEMLMIERMGKILPETLRDPKIALTTLFTEEMMGAYFIDSLTVNVYYKALGDVVRKAVEESLKAKKIVRVLEIGGRLGGLSKYICAALEDLLEDGCVEYVFTDLNIAFFNLVQEKLAKFKNVRYQQLDIEHDIKTQNFVANSIDLVICLDTLHCTANAVEATSNMRDLLCKDGWSILMESTNNHNTPEIIFGAFDLCWVFEDERVGTQEERCWMSQAGWSGVMRQAGYSDILAVSTPNEFYHSLIVGRKTNMALNYPKYHVEAAEEGTETTMEVEEDPKWVFMYSESNCLIHSMKNKMGKDATSIHVRDFKKTVDSLQDYNGPVNVVLFWDDSDSQLINITEIIHTAYPALDKAGNTLWVVTKSAGLNNTNPHLAALTGFIRSAQSEIRELAVYRVDLEEAGINNQIRELSDILSNHTHTDRELIVHDNQVYVPRMVRHSTTQKMDNEGNDWKFEAMSSADNALDQVNFHGYEVPKPGPGQVRVLVHASGISSEDISAANDCERKSSVQIGSECSGIVESVGPGVINVHPSSQVIAFGSNTLASSVVLDADNVFPKPSNLSMTEAAAVGRAYANAYYALAIRANLKKGQTVLIHSAHTAEGQACVEVAKYQGANVVCTSSKSEMHAYLKGQCGLPCVADAAPEAFYADVMKWTNGQGVDVVCNFTSGDVLECSIDCLRHGGQLCQISEIASSKNARLVMAALQKNVSYHSIHADTLMKEDPASFRGVLQEVLTLLEEESLGPIPIVAHSVSDIAETFKTYQEEEYIGRVVAEIPASFAPSKIEPPSQLFNPEGTYVITGSSGGVGQELCRWMVKSGARHLALISSKGHRSWFQKSMIREVEAQGATVYEIRTDLTKEKKVKETFRRLTQNGKPNIRGIFHLAGVNQDVTLEDMTSDALQQELQTRASSAHVLHDITCELNLQLDHFVMFSSSKAAWGNPSLAPLCASCCVLDALATKRREDGLNALSVQCGWIRGCGWLENKSRTANLEQYTKGASLHVHEFLSLLHKVILRKDLPPVVMLANEDWDAVSETTYVDSLLFRHYASGSGKRKGGSDLSKDDLERKVVDKLGNLLMMSPDDIDVVQPMIHYGVDSLISLDITNWMRKEFNLNINQMDILEGMTTDSLIQQALE